MIALLERGANVDQATKNNGLFPLYAASQNGHLEVVKMLLDKGADTRKASNNRMTPYDIALQNGHSEVVELLRYFLSN